MKDKLLSFCQGYEICDKKGSLFSLKWTIEGYPDYAFFENKKLYNLKNGREIKQVLKGGYTRGYNLNGKFISLCKLRGLVTKKKPFQN